MTIHQNLKLTDMVDPKCIPGVFKLPIWVHILHLTRSKSKISKHGLPQHFILT